MNENLTFWLVGNPNTGKTLLFNRLTGLRGRVANFAGVTVEIREGTLELPSKKNIKIVDLPGTYSLSPRAEDESIAVMGIKGELPEQKNTTNFYVVIADLANLNRNLYLAHQMLELGRPFILVLNMADQLNKVQKNKVSAHFNKHLGIPTILTSALKKEGLNELLDALAKIHENASLPQAEGSHKSIKDLNLHSMLSESETVMPAQAGIHFFELGRNALT